MINPCEAGSANAHRTENTFLYALTNLYPMENHPFKVRNDEDMDALIDSIRQYGVLNPLIVRKRLAGGYEIVSGHRRYEACKHLGKYDVPVIVRDLTDDEAILTMVDSNLHREHIAPSEKAAAYKMRMDALRHQGVARRDGTKRSDEQISAEFGDSPRQVQRYIRLNYLIPELLEYVDLGRISVPGGEHYSYLRENEQRIVSEMYKDNNCWITGSGIVRLRATSADHELSEEEIKSFWYVDRKAATKNVGEKTPRKQSVKLSFDEISNFFPNMKSKEIKSKIIEILLAWYAAQSSDAYDINQNAKYGG